MPEPPEPPRPSRFAPYTQALQSLSTRTRTPLPSLILSFAVLHELTALVPLAGFFFGAKALGVGDKFVQTVIGSSASSSASNDGSGGSSDEGSGSGNGGSGLVASGWVKTKSKEWVEEGTQWAEKVGRRYGMFGFEKRASREDSSDEVNDTPSLVLPATLAGDAANAIVAYALTKALLPVRVGASLYLSPAFSRRVVEPLRQAVMRPFRRR